MVSQMREVNKETFHTNEEPLNRSINDKPEVKRTCFEKCVNVFKNVTVEPAVLLYFVPYMVASLASTNLGLEKACRVNLNFSDEICTAMKEQTLGSHNEYEMEAQKLVAATAVWRTYITATIPCVIGLFIGSFQDRTGHRKIFLIYSVVGQMLSCINNMLNVYFFNELNLEFLVLTESIIDGLSGGLCIITLTVYSYISAITTEKERTFRLGLVNLGVMVGLPVGSASSGFLLNALGYYGSYGVALSINFVNAMYNTFMLKDPKRTVENKKHDKKGVCHFFRTFFDLTNIQETVKVVFKNGPNRRRLRMCILLVVVTFLYGPMLGEMSVVYLSTRYRFNWDEVKYSLFQAYNFVTFTTGTIFAITVFSKYLQWHDALLGIISTVSKIAGSFVYCFAPNQTIFFMAPLVEILSGSALLALRSIFSKTVAPDEFGKVNSIIGMMENLTPLVYVPLYTLVYRATMEVLPGLVFLLGAAMTLPAAIAFTWLFVEHRRGLKKTKADNETEISLKPM